MKAVKKTIDAYAQERHKLIHRHSHMDSDLRKIELLYMHSRETWRDDGRFTYDRLVSHRAKQARDFTTKKKQEFKAINSSLVVALVPLFDGLLTQYRRQKQRLEKLV
jgi:hypothetical protein